MELARRIVVADHRLRHLRCSTEQLQQSWTSSSEALWLPFPPQAWQLQPDACSQVLMASMLQSRLNKMHMVRSCRVMVMWLK